MKRRNTETALKLVCAVICLFLTSFACASDKPNVLFIYLDDFGWEDASYMGSDFFETPNLDKLASEAMIFTNAYSCAANCAPARACLLSGQYTPRHQIFNVGTRPRGNAAFRRLKHVAGVDVLDSKTKTWAHCIQEAGYATATIGKWHLSRDPLPYGFDVNIGGTHSGSPPKGYYPPHDVPGLRNAPQNEYLTDRLNDEAAKFIRAHKSQPWFLYLTHFAVHTPLNAKKELVARYEAKPSGTLHDNVAMATMIQSVDDGVGHIVRVLTELGLDENTIVIFYSDNGGYGQATDMAPLRGYKGTYYEGGIRVPFFVKWPGVVAGGTKCAEPITGVDLYPTLCEMTGATVPDGQTRDGRNLVPLLKRQVDSLEDRPIFWHFPAYLQANGRMDSESRDRLFRTRPCSVVRQGDWKLHYFYEDDGIELYNLRDDIGETNDLATLNPAKTAELLGVLNRWLNATNAPIPSEPNPTFDLEREREALRGE